ncbi:hypothetical protein E4U55_007550 [Claviceps digitariae]|nr:hypothetical protein E4U55_007550 [Claviceps digitariae]
MIALQTQQQPGSTPNRTQAVAEPSTSRVVSKPVPTSQTEDPRGYQLDQLRRRFCPKESPADGGATSLVFKLKPSDPDFPFELAHLECDIRVPARYPAERPVLHVRNSNIPRGFAINIERGWDTLARERKGATILSIVNALDKNLEKLLSEEKKETVKLVTFKDTRHLDTTGSPRLVAKGLAKPPAKPAPKQKEATKQPKPAPRLYVPEPSYSRQQIAEAKAKRAQEVRQLEARLGRLPQFRRSADGIVFTIPIEPKKLSELPAGLRSVNSLHLIVPLLYPLQNLRIQLNNADGVDAEPVEDLFARRAAEQKVMSLTSHVNYLAQNLHILAKQAKTMGDREAAAAAAASATAHVANRSQSDASSAGPSSAPPTEEDKSHIRVIPRPPEWDLPLSDDDDEEDDLNNVGEEDGDGSRGSYSDTDDDDGGAALLQASAVTQPIETIEKGTMLSFPSIELHGIEVLQVSILSLSVKCERCKTTNDLTGLKPGVGKTASCKKCAMQLTAKFHQTLVHEHSSRAGFVHLSGCKVADMLPSTFVPTCARCSTAGPGLVSIRGESMTNVCRECHGKFTLKIPEVKFLFVSPGSLPPPAAGPRRKTEKLGLHAGEALPDKGTCGHYRKSYRWFRFSCCNRVHACDKCHDDKEDHVNEWANRMICGWCSREQNYMVEACGFCGRSVIGKKGRGFWEGGRGTRDQRTMSRKDPRKYKRLGEGK